MIEEINGEFYAYTKAGKLVGIFTTRSAASARLLAWED
jgi:hypothetical protein